MASTPLIPSPLLRRRSVLKAAGGALLASGGTASMPLWAQTETIRVGLPIPLTGPFANEARAVHRHVHELPADDFRVEGRGLHPISSWTAR